MQGVNLIQDLAVVMLVAGLAGWACQRAGLSTVVGFLAAGMLIGPFTPPFSLVTDIGRIETLAQLGLVFLMFSIGMNLSLRKLRRLGLSLLVATFVTALIVYNVVRLWGPVLGMDGMHAVFLGAMLIVSSSAIIGKVLHESGLTHDRAGQMAMGITVLEDVVAVVSLALLNSVVLFGGAGESRVGETLGLLGAFVVLAGIVGLLAIPWLLRKLSETAGEELQTLLVAGVMLGLALAAQRAGYSLAMGAFIIGTIVAETPFRGRIERVFEGARDMFSAVFFVSIGMQIDVRLLGEAWLLVLGVSALALVTRVLAGTVGVLATGVGLREALRVGLMITPIGEFSFIIAQLGVTSALVPQRFQALAVGLSFVTALLAPVLTRRAAAISDRVAAAQPQWVADGLQAYHDWLERLLHRQQKNMLWRLCRTRVVQIVLEVLLVTGLLVFSGQLFALVEPLLPADLLFPGATPLLFWTVLGILALVPLVAIWRNVAALAMILADFSTTGHEAAARLRPIVETGLKVAAGVLVFFWLSAIAPTGEYGRWIPLVALALAGVAVALLRRRMIYWHSVMEVELQARLAQDEKRLSSTNAPWLARHAEWKLALTECVLPDLADVRGRTIGELGLRTKFGVTVTGIERQGMLVGNPTPTTALYPRDKLLLLGDPQHTAKARDFLEAASGADGGAGIDEVRMETVTLRDDCRHSGKTLAELAPSRHSGVQVAGINRGGLRILNPGGDEKLLGGDDVLVLGNAEQIAAFKRWAGRGEETAAKGRAAV